MLRSAPACLVAFSLLTLLSGCAKEEPKPPPQAAYVPPPLPVPPEAPWCARPAEVAALSVAALKTNLMVTALSCNAEDKYNAFISRYRPSLLQQEKTADGYFSRNEKRRWQQSRDDYITQLANAQSQRAMVLGNQFCERNMGRFDEVMTLSKPEELPGFAESKTDAIPQAMKFSECAAPPPPAPKPVHTAAHHPVKKKK